MPEEMRQRVRPRTAYEDLLAVKGRHMVKKTWRRDIEIPIIAAVNGWAIGMGVDEALACDIIIASEDAKFAYFYARRGVVTDQGGAWYLARLAGTYRAMRYILTGDIFDANKAYEMGIVTDIVPRDKLLDTAIEIGKKIAEYDPRIIRMDKDLIYKAQEMDFNNWMDYLIMPQIVQDFDPDILAFRKASAEKFYKRKG
jgi:enoyl-CoA hydratase/carnithine racemase